MSECANSRTDRVSRHDHRPTRRSVRLTSTNLAAASTTPGPDLTELPRIRARTLIRAVNPIEERLATAHQAKLAYIYVRLVQQHQERTQLSYRPVDRALATPAWSSASTHHAWPAAIVCAVLLEEGRMRRGRGFAPAALHGQADRCRTRDIAGNLNRLGGGGRLQRSEPVQAEPVQDARRLLPKTLPRGTTARSPGEFSNGTCINSLSRKFRP